MPPVTVKDFTAEEIANIARALKSYGSEIEKLAEEMQAAKIEKLAVKGVAELGRAEERIGIFSDNVRTALRKLSRPRMFGAAANANEDEEDDRPKARRGRPAKKGR